MGKLYTCQCCHGYGGETEAILDDGSGPWTECWACKGKGQVTGPERAMYLGVMSGVARERKRNTAGSTLTGRNGRTVRSDFPGLEPMGIRKEANQP